jgi:peptidoglycan/LPS O-acetylase OafA/YrhL
MGDTRRFSRLSGIRIVSITAGKGQMDSYPEERGKATKIHARAPGLDGVRALAVLAVMGFHAGASELSGGFLGVDVFFVLSGFLITDLLVAQYGRLGRLDLKNFWARRARRLLPPLAVMLVVVTAASTVIEPSQESSLRLALLAAATYTSNWYQIVHHVSYFASLGPMPPLDHLWSLAIEEQFYLIWPLILWFLILRLNGRRAWVVATLAGAGLSALAMALEYTPSNPSAVYYGTYTHASGLLIGATLALACPLATLTSTSAERTRRLDALGIAGLAVLAWAIGHFSGSDPAVYPVGLILAALGAAGLVAAAASNGVIAAMTGLPPLRWVGVRSYAMYLWHWPVIALTGAVAGRSASAPWLWAVEVGVTIALAAVSWQFIEGPILQNGFRVTCRHWIRLLTGAGSRAGRRRRSVMPTAVAAAALAAVVVASYGIARPPAPVAPAGLLRQVAEGQRVSAASQATQPPQLAPEAAQPTVTPTQASACHVGNHPPTVSGWQVSAIGDSVMVASAAALQGAMPGIYVDAQVGRQMATGLAIIRSLVARHRLRHIVVVGLGTNGDITAAQMRQLRHAVGSNRDLVLINTFGPMQWETGVNEVIATAVRHTAHAELANWNQAIKDRTYLLWPDGIHPRPSGAQLYARVVLAAIRADLSRGQSPSCPGPSHFVR